MADAKKCDRCGKLFEPYLKFDEEGKDKHEFIKLSIMHEDLDNKIYQSKNVYVDLCNECYESFSKWLAKPKVVKHECLRFGNINKKSNKCKLCQSYQECKKVTEEKEEKKENKQKGCKVFGAFGGTPYCSMCPQCYECREVTNSIKEASSNGE